jgi:putative RNA 2'-phosphotransferase
LVALTDRRRLEAVSRYLARHLRHQPGRIGLTLDGGGWVGVDELLEASAGHGFPISRSELLRAVAGTGGKVRYEVDPGGGRIRARHGHSVPVDLGLEPAVPPAVLFHGTVARFLPAIEAEGLQPRGRQHVHLSADVATAQAVGRRRGEPVVLTVAAGEMAAAGHRFWRAASGVWLTGPVPARFLARQHGGPGDFTGAPATGRPAGP